MEKGNFFVKKETNKLIKEENVFKEIIISIIIIIFIIALDFITQNYTKETVVQTTAKLSYLKEKIKTDGDKISNDLEEIYKNWEERGEKLAYFIEHDELEKVETNLTKIRSFIETNELDMAIGSIDEAKFILEHIKEKNAFNLENIF